jgi:hypothetical protein
VLIIPSSWSSQLDGDLHHQHRAASRIFLAPLPGIEEEEAPTSTTRSHVNLAPARIFLAPLPGKKKTSAREVSHTHPLLCFKFCFTLFLLASFYQKYKKISFLYSCLLCLV